MNSKLYCINPNTKEYEEVKSIFGINIEEILDLIRDYKISKDLKFDKFGRLEEIERLNNIIETFEEELEREINIKEEDTCIEHNTFIDIRNTLKKVLKRLQELKGNDKE